SAVLVYQYQGWPAGLALWLMAWRSAGMPDRWSSNLGLAQLTDYLEGEVTSGVSSELRDAVCAASALGTFNVRLLQECGEVADAHTSIRHMLHRGLYLREVVGRPEWYRIDPLIGRSLARLIPLAERELMHQKAYQWFRDRNDPIAAMYHVTQSGEQYSPEWLAGESETILAELDTQGLTTWFDQLNEDQLHASPALMKIACWTHLLTYRLEPAQLLLDRLIAGQRLAEPELYALQGYMAGLRGELTRAERFCRQAIEELSTDRVAVRFLVTCMLASVAVAHRDPDGSRVWNRLALDIARKAGKPALEAMAHLDHARIEFNRGNVSRCLQVLNYGCDVLDASQRGDTSMAYARLQILRATVGWITGVSEEKTDCAISKALILCEERSDPATTYGYAIRALNLMGEGQYSRALSVLDDGERRLQESRVDFVAYAWLHTVRSNIWISQKKYRRAYDCIEALLDGADTAGVARCEYSALLPGFSTLTLSRLHLMSGQIDECLALTARWLKNTPNGLMSVFIRLIRAGAFAVSSQTPESLRQIELVKGAFKARGVNSQLHSWLPDILPLQSVPDAPAIHDLATALSDREKDVLKLMAQGLSNQEIAENLFISLHTVKTHARKVNVKLGTRSRTQAIHRAKELMII
ncbi:MAG: LuxR C-terminal-related transcriptional regulator, partial [Thalassolituus sp.]